jgi:hypothetical protein
MFGRFLVRADVDATMATARTVMPELANVGKNRNVAIAEFEIDGMTGRVVATSGQHSPAGTVGLPPTPMFSATRVGSYVRGSDSEYKIFEYLGANISDPSASGSVRILTERAMCASCSAVREQFRMKFPNIQVTVVSGNK